MSKTGIREKSSSVELKNWKEINMRERPRNTGIEIVGEVPWGTHLCQFYQTKEDLIDILVPYFKEGLENNEFCMWIISEPLSEKEAKDALSKAVPNFDRYVEKGQIEIVPYSEWYLKGGTFNMERVLNEWLSKLNQALANGYDGMRLTGNTLWLEKKDWKDFVDYEEEVNNVIGKHRMIAICTCSLDNCGASEIIDVVNNHQTVLIRRGGKWELMESSEHKKAEASMNLLSTAVKTSIDAISVTSVGNGKLIFCNDAFQKQWRIKGDFHDLHYTDCFDDDSSVLKKSVQATIKGGWTGEMTAKAMDGRTFPVLTTSSPVLNSNGKIFGLLSIFKDITERKQAEEEKEQHFQELAFLSRMAMEFVEFPLEGDIYTLIGERLKKLAGNSVVIINSFDKSSETFCAQATAGIGKLARAVQKLLGTDIIGMTSTMNNEDARRALFSGKLAKGPESIHELSFGKVPKIIGRAIEKLIGFGETYVMGFTWNEELYGSAVIIMRNGAKLKNAELIETFINQTSVALQRKRVEEALQESEEKYRNLIEGSYDMIQSVNPDGTFNFVNRTWLETMDYNQDEVQKLRLFDIIHPDYLSHCKELFKKVIAGESVNNIESVFITKDGRNIYVEGNAVPRILEGKIVATQGFFRDITERKKAVEERDRAKIIVDTVDAMVDGVLVFDLDGVCTFANPQYAQMFGLKQKDFLGKSILDIPGIEYQKPGEVEKFMSLFKEVIEVGKAGPEDLVIIATDRREVPISVAGGTIYDVEGKPTHTIAVIRDITERKQMEEELKRHRNHLEELVEERTIELTEINEQLRQEITERKKAEKQIAIVKASVDAMVDAVQVFDLEGNVIFANEAYFKMFGFEDKDVIGKNIMELPGIEKQKPEEVERFMPLFEDTLMKGYSGPVEISLITRDGSEIPLSIAGGIVKDAEDNPKYVVTVMRDITERKKAEEEFLQSKKLASIGQLTAGVAHEINTPLTNIRLIATNISNLAKDPEVTKKLKTISEQTRIVTNIVQSLLSFSAKIMPKFEAVSLNEMVSNSLSSFEGKRPKNIEIVKNFHVDLPNVKADFVQLQQVFTNIIENAYDAMPEGGKLTLTTTPKNDSYVEVKFMDTGIGIPKEDIEKIFDPFFTRKEVGKGIGLGLSICHGIIHAHNGTMEVESEEGKGTTFTIDLPR